MKNITLFIATILSLSVFAQSEVDSIHIGNTIEMGACQYNHSYYSEMLGETGRITIYGDIFGSFNDTDTYVVEVTNSSSSFASISSYSAYNVSIDTLNNSFSLNFGFQGQPVCINCYRYRIKVVNKNYTSIANDPINGLSVFPVPESPTIIQPTQTEFMNYCLGLPVTYCATIQSIMYPQGNILWQDLSGNDLGNGSCISTTNYIGKCIYIEGTTDVGCFSQVYVDYYYSDVTTFQSNITYNNDTLFADLPNYGYQWYLNGNAITGATQQYYIPLAPGSYTVETIYGTCAHQSTPFAVTTVGIANTINQNIEIFPNPFSTQLNVVTNGNKAQCKIYNLTGKVVLDIMLHSSTTINTQALSAGMYVVSITTIDGNSQYKYIKQ